MSHEFFKGYGYGDSVFANSACGFNARISYLFIYEKFFAKGSGFRNGDGFNEGFDDGDGYGLHPQELLMGKSYEKP